jgi:predicted ribosomally synthesized peptide with nif11-like leader
MSRDDLQSFIKAIQEDDVLRERLGKINDYHELAAIAKEAGFPITVEDLQLDKSEISDEDLDGVAGAGSPWSEFSPSQLGKEIADAMAEIRRTMEEGSIGDLINPNPF